MVRILRFAVAAWLLLLAVFAAVMTLGYYFSDKVVRLSLPPDKVGGWDNHDGRSWIYRNFSHAAADEGLKVEISGRIFSLARHHNELLSIEVVREGDTSRPVMVKDVYISTIDGRQVVPEPMLFLAPYEHSVWFFRTEDLREIGNVPAALVVNFGRKVRDAV